ncbi:MAG: hypothetical protein NTV82_00680, partial [Candidatus Aminicenantes bacterium]|nr:hypothetical protein [Candidatus Aminicenantes bacterium]
MIDKRISKSDKLAALPHDRSRVLYFMIYPHLDVKGRYSGDPRDIKEDCCPRLSYTIKQIAESLIDLHEVGLLFLYEVDNKPYIEVTRFDDFQIGIRPDREAASEIPAPISDQEQEQIRRCLPKEVWLKLWDDFKKSDHICPLCQRKGERQGERFFINN